MHNGGSFSAVTVRVKDGKEHNYWSIVENRRGSSGQAIRRQVLYLGEINGSQKASKHWTRQQAINCGVEPREVERYVVFPGQACSYMIGELKIIELRNKAKKEFGDRFSLQQFHDVVLDTGMVPLDILERQVDAYVRSASGRRKQ